jgi:hypothetical protein
MKKILKDARDEAKTLPKGLWVAAIIVPFGIVTLTVYLAGKTAYQKFTKKEEKDTNST